VIDDHQAAAEPRLPLPLAARCRFIACLLPPLLLVLFLICVAPAHVALQVFGHRRHLRFVEVPSALSGLAAKTK
jgi:hypothetical protein